MFGSEARRERGSKTSANHRLYLWYGTLLFICAVIVGRLFWIQIVKHDYYQRAALADQLRQYSIPADRGTISAHSAGGIVPIVLNQKLYTLYGDPTLVKNADGDGQKIAKIIGGSADKYTGQLKTKNTRYVVLGKRLSQSQSDKITSLKLAGIGTQGQDYRTYPDGDLASQLLGFVNDNGVGTYGVEQALNKQLAGTPGMLKAITDVNGVPLAASPGNIQIAPKSGDDVVLTIDMGMQKQLETYLAQDVKHAKSQLGSALIMDINTGAVKAMANYPTYDPSQFYKVTNPGIFNNAAVSDPFEPGSIMKTLTTAAALDQGVITPDTTFYDPGQWKLDGSIVKNVEEDGGAGPSSIAKLLNLSMNTGATWELMQMGHQTGVVNQKARDAWHDYMVNHYQFGKLTGIDQGYESGGYVPPPDSGYGLQLTYANTAFGQAMTATPLQMAAALSSVLNGGTYYKPRLVDQITNPDGSVTTIKPRVVRRDVASPKVGQELANLMVGVVQTKVEQGFPYMRFPAGYMVGGKTGTAQIASPAGGYYDDRFNGTFIGYVGGDKPQYVIMVAIHQPHIGGYAGTTAAMPLFSDLAHMLINDYNVTPKTGS
ncbi:MAG TPA: penicillin-binding protein 2 [Candidatus Saccharimonadales bacterium]|nr:penicillin-binding protein 2 [Candidatus Saccharimonadales bacterium]